VGSEMCIRDSAISGILSAPNTITTINSMNIISVVPINKNIVCGIMLQI